MLPRPRPASSRRGLAAAILTSALFASALACHRPAPPALARTELTGLTLPLSSAGPRLAARGLVEDQPAEVLFDLAAPLTTLTAGCFPLGPPSSHATVRVPQPGGGSVPLGQVRLPAASVGDVALGGRPAGLVRGRECALALGSDVLARYALDVDPVRRELRVLPPRPRDAYARDAAAAPASEEWFLVELARDPSGDWPLLSAELRQGPARLAGAFVLSTREASSFLDEAGAGRAGFTSEAAALRALGAAREHEGPAVFGLDALELLPGLSLERARLVGERDWGNTGALGLLGADVWGRFHATFDLGAGLLVLRRPRMTQGAPPRCGASAGDCFALTTVPGAGGLRVAAAVWRDLPAGGRLYLQPLDGEGRPLDSGCEVGFTFQPADRGASLAFPVPWTALPRSLPACAEAWANARGARVGRFEEGSLAGCPGDCAFATDAATRRARCECLPSGPPPLTDAERPLLQRWREDRAHPRPGERPADDEPDEPESGP